MNVPKASYEIMYNGKNITGNIVPYILSLVYTDKTKGEADEIELTVEDSDGLWSGNWYPQKGDTISAKIFYLGNTLNCGVFTVDELTGEGSSEGNTVTIKGLAAGINKTLRTKRSYAHENKTLREIVNTIASKHGFKIVGTIRDVRIARETQYYETDLSFLNRLATDYGYHFSIQDQSLVFVETFEIENKESAFSILKKEIINWNITDKTAKTYKNVHIAYHNPRNKSKISVTETEDSPANDTVKTDTLFLKKRVENKQQAELKSKAALHRANSQQQSGNVEISGNVLAVAGNNCTVEGIGWFSGKYQIETSTHSVTSDGGYTTSLEIKRTGLISKEKQDSKKKKND